MGIDNIIEMDWWETRNKGDVEIISVPVHHWSQRIPFIRNRSLWVGWIIRCPGFSFFFAADSGYTPHFKQIGQKFGPFDISAIPIGAYEPQWFMRRHHMSPEEAVQVHIDVKSKKSVGIHWGTFPLTDEPLDEPPKKLEKAKKAKGLQASEFIVLKHGETILIPSSCENFSK